MKIWFKNINMDSLEMVVDRAHGICDKILLFEAISIDEEEIRFFLDTHHLTDEAIQNTYIHLVKEYDRQTGGQVV